MFSVILEAALKNLSPLKMETSGGETAEDGVVRRGRPMFQPLPSQLLPGEAHVAPCRESQVPHPTPAGLTVDILSVGVT